MGVVNDPWVKMYQKPYLEDARNKDLPLWLRVSYLAYGSVAANGHANFERGEIAAYLDKPPNRVSEAIKLASKYGHLSPESSSECLVVPPNRIGGGLGNSWAECGYHAKRQAAEAKKIVDKVTSRLPPGLVCSG